MNRVTLWSLCGALMVGAPLAQTQTVEAAKGVTLKFQNLRPDSKTLPAYITFGGAKTLTGINLADNTPLVKENCVSNVCTPKSYKLSDLSAGVLLTVYDSGRIFVSLGTGLTTPNAGNGYAANFANPDPLIGDFTTRWDKIEITFTVSPDGIDAGGANLTSQDFFGIPLQITTSGGGKTPANLTWREDTASVFQQIGKLSDFKVITVQNATGAVGLGNNGVTVPGVTGSVVRILSPANVTPTNSAGDTVYPSLADYITYMRTGNKTTPQTPIKTIIAGHNGQPVAGGAFQVYKLTATISNSAPYTIGGKTINKGDLVLTGTVDNGDGKGAINTTIWSAAANLTDHATYGANPAALQIVPGPGDFNGIVEKVTADFFSAINFGLAGSTVDNPAKPGTAIGDSPSWTWYGNNVTGQGQSPLPVEDAFAKAQPSNTGRYNQYAAYLTSVSDTYGFAYNDRLQSPLAPLADGSTLTLSILPDVPALTAAPPSGIGIANGASFAQGAPIAPGSIAVVSGNLPVSYQISAPGSGVPLPGSLSGLTVQLDSIPEAPLFSVAPDSAVVQVPWELEGQTHDSIVVNGSSGASEQKVVDLAKFAPGIFTANGQGTGQGQIFNVSNVLVDESSPVKIGDAVVIYCTGLGPVPQPPPTGTPTPLSPLQNTINPPNVYIGGALANVLYSGLTPGSIGLYQVNAQVPKSSATGPAVEVLIEMGGMISNSVTMAVK